MLRIPYDTDNLEPPFGPGEDIGVPVPPAANYKPSHTATGIIRHSLQNPVASPPLRELAKGKKNIVLITSDRTRPVPSHITQPLLLEEIREGSPRAAITLLIATGLHRGDPPNELEHRLGRQVLDSLTVINRQAIRGGDMVFLGTLPSGGELPTPLSSRSRAAVTA